MAGIIRCHLYFFGVWSQLGLIESDFGVLDYLLSSFLLFGFGMASLLRRKLFEAIESIPSGLAFGVSVGRDVLVLLIVAIASATIIDLAWMGESYGVAKQFFLATVALFALVEIALYALGQRTGALISLVPIASFGFGAAQYFVVQFKGTAILPSDLLVLGTAADVSGGYTFIFTHWIAYSMVAAAACLCLLAFVRPLHAGG